MCLLTLLGPIVCMHATDKKQTQEHEFTMLFFTLSVKRYAINSAVGEYEVHSVNANNK
jgi:hypothetical protein